MEVLPAIRIPLSEPCSFDSLKRLNPDASNEQLAVAFSRLPGVLQEEAWEQLRLRAALEDWNRAAEPAPGRKEVDPPNKPGAA